MDETVEVPVAMLRRWSDTLYLEDGRWAGTVAEAIDAALGERAGAPALGPEEWIG